MSVRPAIAVLGSLNMDFAIAVEHLPAPGETVLGRNFRTVPGGKGANQAYAAGKLSRDLTVRMIGRVGYDLFADQLKASLAAAGVDVSAVAGTRSETTGIAIIQVDSQAQNTIVVAAGANYAVTPADVEGARTAFRDARYSLFQLETPFQSVEAGLRVARSEGSRTILDPAPAQGLSPDLLTAVDLLTPNETEALLLLGRPPARIARNDASDLARALLDRGPGAVVVKLGDQGCCYCDRNRLLFSPAISVVAVDSTAAGDTFNAALAVALAEGRELEGALRFANAAAGLSVTRPGAQASVPSRAEVESLLAAGSVDSPAAV